MGMKVLKTFLLEKSHHVVLFLGNAHESVSFLLWILKGGREFHQFQIVSRARDIYLRMLELKERQLMEKSEIAGYSRELLD